MKKIRSNFSCEKINLKNRRYFFLRIYISQVIFLCILNSQVISYKNIASNFSCQNEFVNIIFLPIILQENSQETFYKFKKYIYIYIILFFGANDVIILFIYFLYIF